MTETEITSIPPLTPSEQSVVNYHTLLNLYRVVRGELEFLGQQFADEPALMVTSLLECDTRIRRLCDPTAAAQDAAKTHELNATIQRDVETQLRIRRSLAGHPSVTAARARLEALFWILQVRAQELLARASAPEHWCHYTSAELEGDFQELFHAMQDTSRNRYRIVHNLAIQGPNDYYVDLRFESARGGVITMPAVLKDVIRDLVANARKYTLPGGEVRAALHCSGEGVRLVVEDTGCGIPEDELIAVTHYGVRGSNVGSTRTLGSGCGLTKAVIVTHQLGGRFWMASTVGIGTRIRLWLPPPRDTQDTPWLRE